MRKLKYVKILSMALISLSAATSFGADFSKADALFKHRSEGQGFAAKAEYEKMLGSLQGNDLVYAMGRIGELYLYIGSIAIPKTDKDRRLQLFGECEKAIERVNPTVVGENPVYYAFKGCCTAFYAESGNLADKIARISYFKKGSSKDIIYTGIAKGHASYLGGAIYRIAAGVYSNQLAALVGLYKPEEAVSMMKAALALPADAENRTGEDYCENHRYLAQAYLGLSTPDRAAAAGALNHAVDYFSASRTNGKVKADFLPDGQEPETINCLETIYEMKDANNL